MYPRNTYPMKKMSTIIGSKPVPKAR